MRGPRAFQVGALVTAASLLAFSCREREARPAAAAATETAIPGAPELKVGDPAPDFSLPGSDGKTYHLSSYRGQQAVVIAWFAKAFTGP